MTLRASGSAMMGLRGADPSHLTPKPFYITLIRQNIRKNPIYLFENISKDMPI
jgi:hypothetical protein